jgi:uncharacterized membrane protein YagU involved in acid resistance
MNQFQAFLKKAEENCSATAGQQQDSGEGDDATVKTAQWLLESVGGVKLSPQQKKTAGPIVHYVFGAAMGGLYGAVVEHKRNIGTAGGAALGVALFAGADELAVPLLGLSQSPTEYPLSVHASALAAHLVYGLSTEVARKKIRKVFGKA